ncbi:DUF968 domain-containing protein [Citrobacter werkmanii]|nr:DUF968 domain-containing protein [Citrobacter werkmanii]ORT71145.1 hypothetical protein BO998_20775 [Citrobacter werkmanii]OSP16673.1 hypothetical protein B6S66_21000 [Citrobacter werkmanii]
MCRSSGVPGDDPYHIVGHGVGGIRTEAGHFYVMLLCRVYHNELHNNAAFGEQKHSSRLDHVLRIQHRALGPGS